MECPHCGSELSISLLEFEENFEYPDKCPFCGCSRTEFAKDSARVLKQIINQRGTSILKNRKVLAGFVADLLNEKPKEQVTLKMAIVEGVGEYFYNMIDVEMNCVNAQKYKVNQLLTEKMGLVPERAEFIMNTFMYAIGLENEISSTEAKEKNWHDRDNAYLNLAEKYLLAGKPEIAEELFYLSSNTGNVLAIRRTIFLVRERNWMPEEKR